MPQTEASLPPNGKTPKRIELSRVLQNENFIRKEVQ